MAVQNILWSSYLPVESVRKQTTLLTCFVSELQLGPIKRAFIELAFDELVSQNLQQKQWREHFETS